MTIDEIKKIVDESDDYKFLKTDPNLKNPMIFVQEYKELIELLGYEPKVFINTKCKISTPFDMIANQIIEESRGKQKHGSCGVGIWETIVRYNHGDEFKLSFGNRDFGDIHRTVSMIKDVWFPNELMANGVPFISDEWKSIVTEKKSYYTFYS